MCCSFPIFDINTPGILFTISYIAVAFVSSIAFAFNLLIATGVSERLVSERFAVIKTSSNCFVFVVSMVV